MNKEWFIFKGTHHLGPFSLKEMADFYETGVLTAQSLVWKEGADKWEALSRTDELQKYIQSQVVVVVSPKVSLPDLPEDDAPPSLPPFLGAPIADEPPPVPLDAFLDPEGLKRYERKNEGPVAAAWKKNGQRLMLGAFALIFIGFVGWFINQEFKSSSQIKIKGIMPVYLERLQETASLTSPSFMVTMALSLDGKTLWVSTNKAGNIQSVIKMRSLPKRILGKDEVALTIKGQIRDHLGKMDKMFLTEGSQFVPGEYKVQFTGKKIHYLNQKIRFLSNVSFFKNLNSTFNFQGDALIYAGTPREFEKKLLDYRESLMTEKLRPYQDKLERLQTFVALLNKTGENYLLVLDKARKGSDVQSFEVTYMTEISPIVQSLVVAANDISKDKNFKEEDFRNPIAPYKEQIQLGKLIGELASDMITETGKFKKLDDRDRARLRLKFGNRYSTIKSQIEINIVKVEAHIKQLSQ